jgi:GNAT superfamily N-acetyltransferase
MSISQFHIRPFEAKDAKAFRELNEEWIAKHFGIEEQDRITLGNPELSVLQPGGQIFMAFDGEQPVGCCALLAAGPGFFEVAKMAVSPAYRGRGIGRSILEYTIAQAKTLGAKTLHLASNTSLPDAIHLYESFGFRHVPREQVPHSPYTRSNVFMDLQF